MSKAERAANPSFSSAKSTLITVNAPSRWSPKRPYAAHLRIKADPGTEQAVYNEFDPDDPGHIFTREQGYNGHALCHGSWDVLVELGANAPQDLDALVAIASNAPHVKSVIVTTAAMPPQPAGSARDLRGLDVGLGGQTTRCDGHTQKTAGRNAGRAGGVDLSRLRS